MIRASNKFYSLLWHLTMILIVQKSVIYKNDGSISTWVYQLLLCFNSRTHFFSLLPKITFLIHKNTPWSFHSFDSLWIYSILINVQHWISPHLRFKIIVFCMSFCLFSFCCRFLSIKLNYSFHKSKRKNIIYISRAFNSLTYISRERERYLLGFGLFGRPFLV